MLQSPARQPTLTNHGSETSTKHQNKAVGFLLPIFPPVPCPTATFCTAHPVPEQGRACPCSASPEQWVLSILGVCTPIPAPCGTPVFRGTPMVVLVGVKACVLEHGDDAHSGDGQRRVQSALASPIPLWVLSAAPSWADSIVAQSSEPVSSTSCVYLAPHAGGRKRREGASSFPAAGPRSFIKAPPCSPPSSALGRMGEEGVFQAWLCLLWRGCKLGLDDRRAGECELAHATAPSVYMGFASDSGMSLGDHNRCPALAQEVPVTSPVAACVPGSGIDPWPVHGM